MTDLALIMHPTQPTGVGCLGCICTFEDLRLYAGYMLIIWLHCIQPWLLQANDVRGYHMIHDPIKNGACPSSPSPRSHWW